MPYSLPAMVVTDWFDKLIITNILHLIMLLALMPVFSRWLFRRENAWLYGFLSLAVLAIVITPGEVFLMAVEHPEYAGGLLPGLLGLLVFRRDDRLRLFAIPLMLFASWVNITVPVFLGGLVFLKHLTESREWQWKRFLQKALLLAGSMGLVLVVTKATVETQMHTSIALSAPSEWLPGLMNLWQNAFQGMTLLMTVIFVSTLGNLVISGKKLTSASMIVPLGALGFSGFLALLEHVGAPGHGGYRSCYMVPVILILLCAPGLFLGQLIEKLGVRSKISPVWIAVLPVIVLARTGLPSRAAIIEVFDAKYGHNADQLIELEATHIGGISWYIFDNLFYTNYLLQGSDHPPLEAYGFRDTPFRHKIDLNRLDQIRIGVPHEYDYEEDPFWINRFDDEIAIIPDSKETSDKVSVYRVKKREVME